MPPVFPTTNLALKVELLVNATWTDITAYVYNRDSIEITNIGRPDWTSSLQAGQMTLTLNNRDARFTPKLSAGAYYPYITRNTQIRVSVNAQSVTGVTYSGYRFWGEVSEWPPTQDVSGHDIYTSITASGIWRRLSQLSTTLGSAYRRYNTLTLTGANAPQSYWPMEDGSGSGQMVAYGGAATVNAVQNFVTGTNGLSFASSNLFPGSDGIPTLNAAEIEATVASGGTATNNVTRFLLSVPAGGDSASGTTDWNIVEVNSAGTIAKFELFLNFAGTLAYDGKNSGGTTLFSGTTTTNVQGKNLLVSLELTPSGSSVAWAVRLIAPGAAGILESDTGTVASSSTGAVSTVNFNRAQALMDTAVGHLWVGYGTPFSLVAAAYALNGYAGEFAMTRFSRICGEMGIAAETIGTASTTAGMGPQMDDTLANVLQIIESTDMGLLYESRDQFGLGYRSLGSMQSQSVAATFNWNSAILDPSLVPIYDDALTWNNITVTNWDGYAQQAVLSSGAMSILNPPSGIGNGYQYTRTVSAFADTQIAGIATTLLDIGSVDDVRYPVITIQLVRTQAAAIFSTLPSLRVGDYFQITNPPSYLTSTAISQLMFGLSETLSAREWTFQLNAVSELPYATGYSPGTVTIGQIPGGSASTSTAPGTSVEGIPAGSITAAMLNNGVTIHALGGSAITVAASAPSSPALSDIWINSTTGLISQWNGSIWASITFNAADVLQATSITAAQVAAGVALSNIGSAGLTTAYLAAGAAVGNLTAGSVAASLLAAGAALSNVGAGGITSSYIAANAIVAGAISAGAVTTGSLAANAVTAAKIAANTITSSQIAATTILGTDIAAGTIAAGNLQAAIVVAGIVDSTTVQASQYIATSTQGEFLAYSGTPGSGNLITSIAGASGSDTYSNSFPQGLMSQQLTLVNQSSAPAAFSGAGSFYSSVANRPRYLSGVGTDTVLERSTINMSSWPMGNSSTPVDISAPLSYLANEGTQSSEYEIEILGTGTWGSTAGVLTLWIYINSTQNATMPIGAAAFSTSQAFAYRIVGTVSIETSTTAHFNLTAWLSQTTGNRLDTGITGVSDVDGNTFTTTSNQTIQLYASVASPSVSFGMNTYRTRLTRRM